MVSATTPCEPPFLEHFKSIFKASLEINQLRDKQKQKAVAECELPLIDLRGLTSGNKAERTACIAAIAKASSEWGFFQVLNHGINLELLAEMKKEQRKLFKLPFEQKVSSKLLNDSYRWGTPSATSLDQFSWSEAFHVPLAMIPKPDNSNREFDHLRYRNVNSLKLALI